MSDEKQMELLIDIRNWIRAAAYPNVKLLLQTAMADEQLRRAYQMFDGNASIDQIRIACKMSPNKVTASAQKWISMGLMEVTSEKKRRRIFDLRDFDLCEAEEEGQ